MGDLMQREHTQNQGGIIRVGSPRSTKNCNISETVQDRTKATMKD